MTGAKVGIAMSSSTRGVAIDEKTEKQVRSGGIKSDVPFLLYKSIGNKRKGQVAWR